MDTTKSHINKKLVIKTRYFLSVLSFEVAEINISDSDLTVYCHNKLISVLELPDSVQFSSVHKL